MKKLTLTLTLLTGLALTDFTTNALAASSAAKSTTITGNMVCGHCTLHITKKCQDVVQVTKDGKTVDYFLKKNDTSKAAHGPICHGESEKVTVTGTVADKDGKEIMTPTKIDVVKS